MSLIYVLGETESGSSWIQNSAGSFLFQEGALARKPSRTFSDFQQYPFFFFSLMCAHFKIRRLQFCPNTGWEKSEFSYNGESFYLLKAKFSPRSDDGCGYVCFCKSIGCLNRFANPMVGLCPVFLWCFVPVIPGV